MRFGGRRKESPNSNGKNKAKFSTPLPLRDEVILVGPLGLNRIPQKLEGYNDQWGWVYCRGCRCNDCSDHAKSRARATLVGERLMVVVVAGGVGQVASVVEGQELVFVEAFASELAVGVFDLTVLRRSS